MTFLLPTALWGFLAIPLLLAIYLLVGRSQTRVVSSLFLWTRQPIRRPGGRELKRLQTPLTLVLECMVLLLLVLAAARPHWRQTTYQTPLTLVLDNSFSMLAGGEESPRARAAGVLANLIQSANHHPVRIILAGAEPRLLNEDADAPSDPLSRLRAWSPSEPDANIPAALALAGRLGRPGSRLVVITDHAPLTPITGKAMEWLALGAPLPNLAIVSASRTPSVDADRCFVRVANYSSTPQTLTIRIEADAAFQHDIALDPGADRAYRFEVPAQTPMVSLSLPEDALAIDNHAWLVRPRKTSVRIRLDLAEESLAEPVRRALSALESVSIVDLDPHLLVSDRQTPTETNARVWELFFPSKGEGPAFIGPFAIDRNHVLAEGLSLGGVIWQASSSFSGLGFPLISAGDTPLLSEDDSLFSRRFYMNFLPQGSNLQRSPGWPVLLWNLIELRAQALPGLHESNIPLGSPVEIRPASGDREIVISAPNGTELVLPVIGALQTFTPAAPGIHQIGTANLKTNLAVNALAPKESDLRAAVQASLGAWQPSPASAWRDRLLAPYFVAAALLLLILYAWFLRRQAGEYP